MLIKQTIN